MDTDPCTTTLGLGSTRDLSDITPITEVVTMFTTDPISTIVLTIETTGTEIIEAIIMETDVEIIIMDAISGTIIKAPTSMVKTIEDLAALNTEEEAVMDQGGTKRVMITADLEVTREIEVTRINVNMDDSSNPTVIVKVREVTPAGSVNTATTGKNSTGKGEMRKSNDPEETPPVGTETGHKFKALCKQGFFYKSTFHKN